MPDDFRSMVESAYNEAETGAPDAPSEVSIPTPEPVGTEAASQDTQAAANQDVEPAEPSKATQSPTPPRDPSGKFTKSKTAKLAPPATAKNGAVSLETNSPATAPSATPTGEGGATLPTESTELKAPQSWRPAARETWASLPAAAKQEINRLDLEVRRTMQDSAPAKKFQQEFNQAVAPFEQMFRETGTNPVQAAQAVFQTVHQLRVSGPQQRAQIFANLLRSYPTDIEALARQLDGQAPTPGQPQQMDPNAIIAQAEQRVLQRLQAQRSEAAQAQIARDIQAFASDPKNEFFEDVYPDMVAFIQANPKLSLKQAYDKALWSHDEIRDILQKRQARDAGKAATASTQQARNAASLVKSTPSTGASSRPTPKTHRDIVAAAYEELDGRA